MSCSTFRLPLNLIKHVLFRCKAETTRPEKILGLAAFLSAGATVQEAKNHMENSESNVSLVRFIFQGIGSIYIPLHKEIQHEM